MHHRSIGYSYTFTLTQPWMRESVVVSGVPSRSWRPNADVYESAKGYELTVELPGVHDDDVELLVYSNGLIVQGRRSAPERQESGIYHAAEIRYGRFRLEVEFRTPVDTTRLGTALHDGLLRIDVPRSG